MSIRDEQTKLLRIYLQDHLAGATAGSQRARRLADAEADSTDAAVLAAFAADVAKDREALLAMMESIGVEANRAKMCLASVVEKVGAFKPNGRVAGRSPLSTIVELEAMLMAVRGKRSLWETLQSGMPPDTATADLAVLIARADEQLDVLAGVHAGRVADTFAST